jgi:NAD(P)-dependent dehydrogenase (short-subunit alcohol dehydrogenase family)
MKIGLKMKYVVITGVSTGIGYAAAADLAANGYGVFGSVRRPEDADRLSAELGQHFTPLLFDVTDEGAIRAAASQVEKAVGQVGLFALVNNAGIAVPGPLMHLTADELRHQFEVNLISVLTVTQAFLPLLGAKKNAGHPPGRIINISSISGRVAYPFMGAYAASKHALEAMSDAWRRELLLYGIDMIVIEPGSVRTPIWDKAEQQDVARYADTDYAPILAGIQKEFVQRGRHGIPVERVSRVIRQALESERPKSRYVLARSRLTGWLLPRWLPDRYFDRLVAKRLGLKSK